MKISSVNNISFKSIPIYNVKLKKQNPDGTVDELPATFSKLRRFDRKDKQLVRNIQNFWHGAEYADRACEDFLYGKLFSKEDYYVIEGKNDDGEKEVYSLAEFSRFWDCVNFLQSNPDNKKNGIKGAGEVMLYGIGKEYNKNNGECFHLIAADGSESFYEHIGLKKSDFAYYLKSIHARKFFNGIEKKYNFQTEKKKWWQR